jgi:hypothetical protein
MGEGLKMVKNSKSSQKNMHRYFETFAKRPLSSNFCVRLKF